jgi:dTDP-4-dehydrorhamnose reductase
MIHFSTDYVFDGSKRDPYTEDDPPNPLSAYGRSKLLGESAVLSASHRHLVVRLSWLFGPGKPAFPEWVLREASSGTLNVVADKWACPTFSTDVARWLRPLLTHHPASGLLHLCNPPPCSWLEYAHGILDAARVRASLTPISLADLPGLHAPRPSYSALSVAKYQSLTGRACRPWTDALADHLR